MRGFYGALIILSLAAAPAQGQPAPLPILDVPFVSQSEALCGGAAAAMVLRYWGERGISAEAFASLVDRSAEGIRTTTLTQDLTRRGWTVSVVNQESALGEHLAEGRPVMALIEDRPGVFHYVVIVGLTPRAVIFHDPARAPWRVMDVSEFDRRSRAAGRWKAIVLPGTTKPAESIPAPRPLAPAGSSCDQQVRDGVELAQAGQLDAAEGRLVDALSCPGPSALRELAGVRFLQRRWDDAAQLAAQAAAIDPQDDYSWQLLGTSRFLLNQTQAALDAWNKAGAPRLDLVRVNGLERTRQRPVERILGIRPGELITSERLQRSARALSDLPAARSTRLDIVPAGQGLAELRATIVERDVLPNDLWSWAAVGARAATARTVGVTLGSPAGAGEALSLEWRYWPGRPRIAASLDAPAPWPGTWGAEAFVEQQEFTSASPQLRRRGGRVTTSTWINSTLRIGLRGGADRWNTAGAVGTAGVALRVLSPAERVVAGVEADGWTGGQSFGTFSARASVSSVPLAGPAPPPSAALIGTAGLALASVRAPLDLWPASDTGHARPILSRAHPLLDDGRIRLERVGRQVLFASGEFQFWWNGPALSRIGTSLFADAVRTGSRMAPGGPIGDVDVGAGVGVASLLMPGRIRIDLAHGLRDGADAVSVRYVTAVW